MSNSLEPDQARHCVGADLGPNCLQGYQQTALVGRELNISVNMGKFTMCIVENCVNKNIDSPSTSCLRCPIKLLKRYQYFTGFSSHCDRSLL